MAVDRSRILASAQKQISKGNYDKAILEYQKLVKDDPSDVRTWLKIGDLHTRRGARPEAIETYARVAEHYAGQGFFLKAVAVYKQILKLDSARLDISLRLADMYEQLELVSDALSTYEQVAGAYARNGDVEQALETLARMCDLDPENIPIRIKLAEALSKAGKTKEAAQEFETGAHLLRSQGRIDDYIKVAERLLYHRQDDLETAIALARLYLDRNDAKRALAKLQLCFKANPRDIGTLELLARAFHMLEQIPKTISVYREIVRILHETNKPEERARILKAILELDPGDAEARQALAGYAPRSRPPAAITPPPSAVVEPSGAVPAEEVDDWDLEPSVRRRVTVKPPRPTPLRSTQQQEATESIKRPPVKPPTHPRPEPPAAQNLERKAKESESGVMLLDDDELIEEFEGEDQGAQEHIRLTSIPPDVAQEAQIARLLTECEVFQRYGLRSKVIEQLSLVIQLDPSHRQAREILANTYAEEGLLQEALQELGQLISLTEVALPEAADGYRAQIQALDPADPRGAPVAVNPQEHYQDTAPLNRATFEEDEEVLFVDDESDLIDLTASDVRLDEAIEPESIVPPPADLMIPTRDLPHHLGPAGNASPPEAGTLPAPWGQRNSSSPFEAKGYPRSIPGANLSFASLSPGIERGYPFASNGLELFRCPHGAGRVPASGGDA
ncbi:MAG: tetratricopeptide repeat protein, partial [Myxococcota bacterium]